MLSKEDFQQQLTELHGVLKVSSLDGSDTHRRWQKAFGELTPKDIAQTMRIEGDYTSHTSVSFLDNERMTIRSTVLERFGSHEVGSGGVALRHDMFGNRYFQNTGLRISAPMQGNHIAKQLYKNRAELGQAMGVKSMKLTTEHVGSYAWAKFGFTPDRGSWKELRTAIDARIDRNSATPAICFNEQRHDITAEELAAIDAVLTSKHSQLPTAFPQLTELNRTVGKKDGHEITVGKALLLDQGWSGTLPLNDKHPSFQRFQRYVGGEHTQQKER